MIARIWHGRVPADRGDDYLALMREVAIPEYRASPGNRGAYCRHRVEDGFAHFEMLTFWDDIASIRKFAGTDELVAKYYDFDADFLVEKEPLVRHFVLYES